MSALAQTKKMNGTSLNGIHTLMPLDKNTRIQLINDQFAPADVFDLLSQMIDKQINYYKLQFLSKWECNHCTSTDSLDDKIMALQHKKMELKQMMSQARNAGYQVNIQGLLDIQLERVPHDN